LSLEALGVELQERLCLVNIFQTLFAEFLESGRCVNVLEISIRLAARFSVASECMHVGKDVQNSSTRKTTLEYKLSFKYIIKILNWINKNSLDTYISFSLTLGIEDWWNIRDESEDVIYV
jgi:hypothetical protein